MENYAIQRQSSKKRRKLSIDSFGLLLLCLATTIFYLGAYMHHPALPRTSPPSEGWWGWFDQSNYLKAAKAWATGNLDPDHHWYLPGYALMAAPFVRLMPNHPFCVPDLLCLLASLLLFAKLAERLGPQLPHGQLIGAAVFVATSAVSVNNLQVWVIPWTTTGSVPLIFWCLLSALRFVERPDHAKREAFLSGLAGGSLAAFRPLDAAIILIASAGGISFSALRIHSRKWRALFWPVILYGGGVAVPLLILLAVHVSIYGIRPSAYMTGSGSIGFDWHLLPIRWVTLMLDPRPLFMEGRGAIEVYPWIVPGLAGMLVYLITPDRRSSRLSHAIVIGAAAIYLATYLCYRDLDAYDIWRYLLYHYFKWLFPVFGFYAVLLVHDVVARSAQRWLVLAISIGGLLILLPWRAELILATHSTTGAEPEHISITTADTIDRDQILFLPGGMPNLHDAILVAADGSSTDINTGHHELTIGNAHFSRASDFRLFPIGNGFMLVPLRSLPIGDAVLSVACGVKLDRSVPPIPARQRVVFGMPCWLLPAACRAQDPIPPPLLPIGREIPFTGAENRYLAGGWSGSEPTGRWTDGSQAKLRFRVSKGDIASTQALTLLIDGVAFVPSSTRPLDVVVKANGIVVGSWHADKSSTQDFSAVIPTKGIELDQIVDLTLDISDPRRPCEVSPGSHDSRELGIFAHGFRLIRRSDTQ